MTLKPATADAPIDKDGENVVVNVAREDAAVAVEGALALELPRHGLSTTHDSDMSSTHEV